MARTDLPAEGRPPARLVRNPLSLLRVEAAIGRLGSVIGVLFFVQAVPVALGQLGFTHPAWNVVIPGALGVSLVVGVVCSILQRGVRIAFAVFAGVYLVALVSWPWAVTDVDAAIASGANFWLYLLLTVGTAMASISLPLPAAAVYTIGAPVLYGVIRMTPPGGDVEPVLAVLDSVYSILLGGAILILLVVVRAAASGVDVAQQNAVERYAHAVRHQATESERVQVDSIVHDSVLTTLLSAARAFTPEAKALAASMAADAIGHLREAAGSAPDSDAEISGEVVAGRIESAAASMSQPVRVTAIADEWCMIPIPVAEAAYSATVQAMVNSVQHAGDGVRRWVDIRSHGHGSFTIEIGDDGVGFEAARVPTERLGVRVSIVERVTSAGGEASVTSAPGHGTLVRLHWDPSSAATALDEFDEFDEEVPS